MKRIVIIAICISAWTGIAGQSSMQQVKMTDTTGANEQYWSNWLSSLYEMGVIMEKDSIKINSQAREVINDSSMRAFIYPAAYTWQVATQLLKGMELKKGCWYLFNLYHTDTANKKMVMEMLVPLDQMVDMEKVMMGTFYTYALLDTKLCTLTKGKPVIYRPDLLEKEFVQLKEIVNYIRSYRQQKQQLEKTK